MHLSPVFSTALGWDYLDIDNESIIDYCYQQERNCNNPRKIAGWQSEVLNIDAPELKELIFEIKIKLQEITQLYNIKDEFAPKLTTSWININKPYGTVLQNNISHLHPGRFFGFVYYAKAEPNCGNLNLESPTRDVMGYSIPLQVYKSFNPFNSVRWTITPEPKKLVIFPGWIQHYADNNESNNDRISLAFNADLQNLDKIYYP